MRSVKSQVWEDIVAKFSFPVNKETPLEWTLSVSGTSKVKENGAQIVLKGPSNILIEKAQKFEFTASDNQT